MSNLILPTGVTVLERGWLSSNNVLLDDGDHAVLVDTGYCTHADLTLALVEQALNGRVLDAIINTHLHSDHCGGNAALQARYPSLTTMIPSGLSAAVRAWDVPVLGFDVVGQSIARFGFDSVLQPESTRRLAGLDWDIHAAPGHDTHAVLLFEPASGTLISGDALWAQGFGVVFPELDGDAGFEDVAATLDLIARLPVNTVIPGHGAVFSDVAGALAAARQRLDNFVKNPTRHHRHAAKVMLKYKLLEWGHISEAALHRWLTATPMFHRLFALLHPQIEPSPSQFDTWTSELLADLAHSGALTLHQGWVSNK